MKKKSIPKKILADLTDPEQKRLHAAAERSLGTINGLKPRTAETASELIEKSLRRRYGR